MAHRILWLSTPALSAGPHTVKFTGVSGTGTVFISNVSPTPPMPCTTPALGNISSTTQSESSWATAFGLHMASYEGGFVFGTGWVGTPLQIAANQDPRAEQADITQMNEFYASGGDLAMYYDTTNHIWALTLDINNQSTPKILAVQSVESAPQVPLNFSQLLPTVAGQSVSVANSLAAYAGASGLFTFRTSGPGTYSFVLGGSQATAGVEQFILDGQPVSGLTVLPSAAGTSSPALTFTVNTGGLHSLVLLGGAGSLSSSTAAGAVTITAGSGPALSRRLACSRCGVGGRVRDNAG